MPIMDGLLASQKIREYELIQKADKTVPIIALSADSYSDNVDLLFDAGINYFMEKPFSFNKAYLFPLVPAANIKDAIDAAIPIHIVFTLGFI